MATVISRKYEVVGQLGQGGMGLVYKVRHTALETISALKVLPAYLMENQDMVNRFYREARVMARLNHPNIVRVLDIERDESLNLYYFVMEYIEGVTLGKYLRDKGPLPLPEVLKISHQVADALAYAHTHTPPIIHRDIKPANIMIEAHSSRVVVMDFGIAKELGENDSTKTGTVIGTLKYASPEQLRHEPLDGSADVYSLGMVMYEMYTGKQFFGGLDEHAVLGKVLYDTNENTPTFDRPPPAAFATLLTQAMAKNRDRRYHSMRDLLKAIEASSTLDQDEEASGTIILPGPGGKGKSSKEAPADEDLERQIRELEEERKRRRVLPIQTQARDAHERAAREGAADLTGPLFQQGLTAEERGAKSLRDRDFTVAQQAFEEAIQIFERARAEAQVAATKRKVAQAKGAMAAAKEEAEHYGARDHARTRYTRGLTLESQAEELAEKAEFQQALQIYTEASRSFADARELAYRETLKQEAESARGRVAIAKAAAEEKGAARFAESLFREAITQEERANSAITHEEFSQARELFLAAAQKLERAQQQAQSERQRQEAIAIQQQAREAQGQAVIARARELAAPAYEHGLRLQQQGDAQFQAHAYENAADTYLQARNEYERATQEAELEQEKQTTATVRQQLQQAQTLADRVGAHKRAAATYEQARTLVAQGEESERQQQYRDARDRYTQAIQHFQQLAREVAVLIAQERADAARQEMTNALQGSEVLHTWAHVSWTKAHELKQQAEQAYQKQEYGRATERYTQAAQAYIKARADAEIEQLQQETRNVQHQARRVREQSESVQAERYAANLYRQGVAAQKEAEQQLQALDYRAAIQRYAHAAELLSEAVTTAQRERSRLEATTARQHAEEARGIAERSGAPQRFVKDFSQAATLVEQAIQEEARQDFTQALNTYQKATELWKRLAKNADQEAEKEKAEAARARLAEARTKLSGLNEWRGAKWAEAERHEAVANDAWTARRYTQAAEAYTRGLQSYEEAYTQAEEARKAAEVERQRRRALDARQQAEDARATAEEAEAKQYAATLYQQAAQIAEQATQQVNAQRWLEARELFAQVRSLWSQAAHDAQQAQAQQAAAAIRQRLDAARAAAEEAEAHTRFTKEFTRAQQLTEQGAKAETQQNFTQAADFYEQALQQLLRLRREADVQAEREKAETARHPMLKAKEQATALKQWATAPWDAAQKLEADAERMFKGQDYVAALSGYEQATQAYTGVAEAGERERLRQEALQAEKHAVATKKKAEDTEAPRYATAEFTQGTTAVTEAERHKQQQEFAQATQAYQRAEECFSQAITVAQREQAKLQMQAARQHAEEASSAPLLAEAAQRFPQDLARARETLQHGKTAETQQDFSTAHRDYELAQQQFVTLAQAVQQHIAREHAETAKQTMQQAKKEASTLAPSFAAALWQEAQNHEAEGERSWKAQGYEQARDHYDRAAQTYVRARSEAIEEEQRQQVATVREKAKTHQKEADALQAAQYAGDLYRKAQTVKEQAEAEVTKKKFTEAENLFTQAAAAFAEAITATQAVRAQQLATTAREKAIAAQAEAQAANSEEFLPGQYVEAMSLLREAEHIFSDKKFADARERFERVTARWQQIRQEAEVARQKAELSRQELAAKASKTQADELRERTRNSKNKQQRRAAEKAIATGDQHLQQRRYAQAQASYEEACAILATLQSQEVSEEPPTRLGVEVQKGQRPRPQPVAASATSPQVSPLVIGVAALVIVAASGLYFGVFRSSEPTQIVTPQQPEPPPSVVAKPEPPKPESPKPELAKPEAPKPEVPQPEVPKPEVTKPELAKPEPPKPEPPKPELAKPDVPLAPPKLTLVRPEATGELTIAEGKALSFSAEADSAQPQLLKFAWFIDGKKFADGKKWNYQPSFDDGGDRVREVKVVVTDGKNPPLENVWKVRVEDVDRAPTIGGATPKAGAVTITAGAEQSFSVQASDPDKDDRLVYVWSVDGEEVARGDERSWQLPASPAAASRSVKVEVFDKAGKSVQLAWNVTPKMPSLPPRIVDVEPTETTLTVDAGKPLDFTVTAEVEGPGSGKKELSYLWSIDDARPQRSASGRFRFAETRPGTYQLSVIAVGPEGLQSSTKRWTVEVKAIEVARPQPPPPPKVEPPPPTAPVSATLSQQEAVNWLETTYRQAWESRNVDALVQIGEVTSQDAARLKTILDGYKEYRVSFTDVNVRNEGNRVIVRFSRIDTIDGKTMRPTPAKEVTLEKGDGGRIARRR